MGCCLDYSDRHLSPRGQDGGLQYPVMMNQPFDECFNWTRMNSSAEYAAVAGVRVIVAHRVATPQWHKFNLKLAG